MSLLSVDGHFLAAHRPHRSTASLPVLLLFVVGLALGIAIALTSIEWSGEWEDRRRRALQALGWSCDHTVPESAPRAFNEERSGGNPRAGRDRSRITSRARVFRCCTRP